VKTFSRFVIFSLSILALVVGLGSFDIGKALRAGLGTLDAVADKPAPVTDNLKDLFIDLSRRLMPSVVNIYTTQTVAHPYGAPGQQGELYRRFFEQFFGEEMPNMPQSRKSTSLGTGFVIDEKEGLILTNYHVIADSDEIKVILTEEDADRDGVDAKVVGGDAEADVALLKIKTKRKLQAAPFGDSDALQVGEWVMAIGNPFGHGHTVTKGIISAKERIVPLSQFSNYLQTDTPINPGNSGGPLINTKGEVIGINTAINAAAQGIGFAIPINYVKRILPELRTKGAVTRGFIGVNITEITPQLAKYLKLKKDTRGVIVSEVYEGEPAASAGMQVYDVITEINGKKINDGRQLINTVSSFAPGTTITIKFSRENKEKELKVTVGKRPSRDSFVTQRREGRGPKKPALNIGMTVDEIDSELRREMGLPPNLKGVVVSRVSSPSPAEEAGFERGDVIVEVDQKPTPNVRAFYGVFKEERVYLVRYRRSDGIVITSLDLSKNQSTPAETEE
jgi:serine protease Do